MVPNPTYLIQNLLENYFTIGILPIAMTLFDVPYITYRVKRYLATKEGLL